MVVGHLVWIKVKQPRKGWPRAVAEKWPLNPIGATTNDKTELTKHPLTEDEWSLKLAILEQRYPAPAMVEDAP